MSKVRVICEYCYGDNEKCHYCHGTGYLAEYSSAKQAIMALKKEAEQIVESEDAEDYLFNFVLKVSLLEM